MWEYINYEPYEAVLGRLKAGGFSYVLLEGLDVSFKDPAMMARTESLTFFIQEAMQLIKKNGANHLPGLLLLKQFKLKDRFIYLFKVVSV